MAEQDVKTVWVAYYDDFSEVAVFDDELACRRFAMDVRQMDVAEVPLGRPVREFIDDANHPRFVLPAG